MPKILTDEELSEIEARAAAATGGPWRLDVSDDDAIERDPDTGDTGCWSIFPGDPSDDPIVICGSRLHNWHGADAVFMAHARGDIPLLLAEIRRLRAHR